MPLGACGACPRPRSRLAHQPHVSEEKVRQGSGPSTQLSRAAREHLGDRRVVELFLARPTNAAGREAAAMMAVRGLKYDPQTVATEAWGQSTEGCVQWFASHFAVGLELPRGFPLRYSLTFPDAPFCMAVGGTDFVERIVVQDSDVSAYVFRTAAGQPFALLVPGVMRDDQGARTIRLRAAVGAINFSNKVGQPLRVEAAETGEFTEAGEQLLD